MERLDEHQETRKKLSKQENRRQYYEANKYALCHHTLNVYCVNKIERIRTLCPDRADSYISRYPFEEYADRYIKKRLAIHRVLSSHGHYHDCYDAGMMAYLYSVHRCAEMSYDHVIPYIKKLVRIYIICALVIHDDTKNLCQSNGFREIRLDSETSFGKF